MKLRVGMQVAINIAEGGKPLYGWGDVKNGDVGTVVKVKESDIWIDFPSHSHWHGRLREIAIAQTPEDLTNQKALYVLHETLLP